MNALATAMILAVVLPDAEPRFHSPDGELWVVVRHPSEAPRDAIDEWLDEYPLPATEEPAEPEAVRGEMYRIWPSGHHELLGGFDFLPRESWDRILVANDGSIVTYSDVHCQSDSELLTIRSRNGSVVRTLFVRDVFTKRDQQWLCRGEPDEVRWSIEEDRLRATILVAGGKWDDPQARHETLDIDLASGAVAAPERDRCPAALVVAVEAMDGLLDRARVRVMPEYPPVAEKARIAGRVRVDVVVGSDGRVQSARVQPLPFGIDAAVQAAIAKWEFAPDPANVSGSLAFRFEIVRPGRIATTTIRCH